jgi:hypothetical protein
MNTQLRIAAQIKSDHIDTMLGITVEDCEMMQQHNRVAMVNDGKVVGFKKEMVI